jgi:hypothetical protein
MNMRRLSYIRDEAAFQPSAEVHQVEIIHAWWRNAAHKHDSLTIMRPFWRHVVSDRGKLP